METLPLEKIRVATDRVFTLEGKKALQYGTTEGYPPLREWIADNLSTDRIPTTADQILITGGSQQAIDLVSRLLLDPAGRVMVEEPSYNGALQALGLNEATIVPVGSDSMGPIPEELDRRAGEGEVAFAYLTPTLQNPSGKTYTNDRRQKIARVLDQWGIPLVEDDPYGKLLYSGETMNPLSSYLEEPSFLTGSFSKTVSPSLRIGYLRIPAPLVRKAIMIKQAMDLHTNLLSQMILYRFLEDFPFQMHLDFLRSSYREKRDLMLEAIHTEGLPLTIPLIPEGGMFLWARLPEGLDSGELARCGLEQGIAIVPGKAFFANGEGGRFIRINYTAPAKEQILPGIIRLKNALSICGY